jgi:hypothetical protein
MGEAPRAKAKDLRVVCDNMDRLVSAPLRTLGHPRAAYVPKLYRRARALHGAPLCWLSARLILAASGPRVAVVTGTYHPVHFPGGETDGPIGAAVLGRALAQIGCHVTFCVEKEILPAMRRFAELAGAPADFEGLVIGSADAHAHLAGRFDGAVFIEKIGANRMGVHHTSSGLASDTDDADVGGLVNAMNAAGKWTIGLGDGGNEIGFGRIVEYVRKVVRYGDVCRCPCGGGIATVTGTTVCFPASISNWAAYSIVAAIALIRKDCSLLHTPEMELRLLEAAPAVGCFEGTVAKAKPGVDAVGPEGSAAMVQLLKSMVETAYAETIPLDERTY